MSGKTPESLSLDPFSPICRGCLAQSSEMKNIYEWGLFQDFFLFAGVPEMRSDGVSELLCPACIEALVGCTKFRDQCQRTDQLLRDTAKKKTPKESEFADLKKIHISNHLTDSKLIIRISTADTDSKIHLSCPYNCRQNFLKQRDLGSHLTKHHKLPENFIMELHYHCPFQKCHYHVDSSKHFSGRKYLNQHLNKVHRSKDIVCHTCFLSFPTEVDYNRHCKTCSVNHVCAVCNAEYKTIERLVVHLSRKHPEIHEQYKKQKKLNRGVLKRCKETVVTEAKKARTDTVDSSTEDICDSPKRSFATQTLLPETNIKNDVALAPWKSEETQTVFEDLLSLKSQNSEDSLFFSETVSLSDIQTQTFPVEFGLSHKETITSETQTRKSDLSIKETQTCFCFLDSPKASLRILDSVSSSPSANLTSTETQTPEFLKCNIKSDVMLSFNSAETQTCFDDRRCKEL